MPLEGEIYIPTANEFRGHVGMTVSRFARRIGARPPYVAVLFHRYGGGLLEPGALTGEESRRIVRLIAAAMETDNAEG